MAGEHVFVDESKRGTYLIAAAVVAPADVAGARARVRGLRGSGTSRIHFQAESHTRRRAFLTGVQDLGVSATLSTATERSELASRTLILERLVEDLAAMGASRLIVERDDSLVVHDERTIISARSKHSANDLRFDHLRGAEDPLLWIPDAMAWCWCRDTFWRNQVRPMIVDVIQL